MMLIIKTPAAVTDTSLPILSRDALFNGSNDGVTFLADFSNRFSYDGTAPANDKAVVNVNESGDDAVIVEQSGQSIGFAGNGIDFSGITNKNNCLKIPASIAADLFANQYFMVCLYIKLPTEADWHTGGSICPFINFASSSSYIAAADLLTVAFRSISKSIGFRRQTAVGAVDNLDLTPNTANYGQFAQVAFWRTPSGQGSRLKTSLGTQLVSAAVGSANVADFSARAGEFGVTNSSFISSASPFSTSEQNTFNDVRIYRAFVENINTSARNPVTVLDADWARTIAKAKFS